MTGDKFRLCIDWFSTGVCFPLHKERAAAAAGDGLVHLLLSHRLQPGETDWLQTANSKLPLVELLFIF